MNRTSTNILNSLLQSKPLLLFVFLSGLFLTNTIVAEFIGIKIFSLEQTLGSEPLSLTLFGVQDLGLNLTAGVLLWPVVFILTDIINEYYGMVAVKKLSYLAIGLIFYAFAMIYLAIDLSPTEWWQYTSGILSDDQSEHIEDMDLAFGKVMGQGLGIIIGSMVAFGIGQIVDVFVFHKIKRMTGERKVWLRATGSTLVSQFIDSYVVLIIAFYIWSDWDLSRVLAIGTVNLLYKFVVAILLTPMLYLAHYMIDNYLGKSTAHAMKYSAANG